MHSLLNFCKYVPYALPKREKLIEAARPEGGRSSKPRASPWVFVLCESSTPCKGKSFTS